jgi:uncharacterized protein (UPF0332 family)
MKYDELIRSRRIRKQDVSREEVEQVLERAKRDLATAEKVVALDLDWGFAVAYNAILQASRAFMFSEGYRPSSRESHKNTLAFMRIALGSEHENLLIYLDRTRTKRHVAVYDTVGLISETEARNLLSKAKEFVEMIVGKLAKGR